MFKNKKSKAFTLSEIFVAMIIIAILGTVCISFMKNRREYSREYMYYSVYQNLQRLVDTIINDENADYTEVVNDDSGQHMQLLTNEVDGVGGLCRAFREYLNHSFDDHESEAVNGHCLGKLANGAEFVHIIPAEYDNYPDAINYQYSTVFPLEYSNMNQNKERNRYGNNNRMGQLLWVDLDGHNNGEDILFYDIMPFFITLNGKVIPEWGQVTGLRGYNGGAHDAGGNATLMSFDVVYTDGNSNKLLIVPNGRGVSFAEAACMAGYVSGSYCNLDGTTISVAAQCTNTADCRVRLVKKLKWSK